MQKSSVQHSSLAVVTSIPWCCILPAALSLFSLTGASIARLWLTNFIWVLLPLSAVFLGRAFWLLYVKLQGARWARWLTWVAAVTTVFLWVQRLWVWIPF